MSVVNNAASRIAAGSDEINLISVSVSPSFHPSRPFSRRRMVMHEEYISSPHDESINRYIPRRLNFDSLVAPEGNNESFISSVIVPVSPPVFRRNEAVNDTASREEEELTPVANSVGDCGICYDRLPRVANHIYTLCGHLFCVRCFLKWWDTSSKCPMCRAELFEKEEEGEQEEESVESSAMDDRIDDTDTDDTADTDTDDADDPEITLINKYLHQYRTARWSVRISDHEETDSNYDDTVIPLTENEIYNLRRNREIAMTLISRMRFRETLFHPTIEFRGEVFPGSWVPREYWLARFSRTSSYNLMRPGHSEAVHNKMYEIVIANCTDFSPIYEVNVFGLITDVIIVNTTVDTNSGDPDYDWENSHEYAFVANIFTPIRFCVNLNDNDIESVSEWVSYGDYDIAEGTVRFSEVVIRFSNIRRVYCIDCHERGSV